MVVGFQERSQCLCAKSQMKMKSSGVVDGGLFTESYCNICNAQLISESQRTAHYESKKHANKVRLFYMLHPEDGGPPSKRLRPDNPDCAETEVDKNKCCTLCNMFFTSAIVAQSHYKGKTHAKRVRLVLGEPPNQPTDITSPENTDSSPSTPLTSDPSACPPPPPALSWPSSEISGNGGREAGKYCCLCGAWFNNPLMAQQHYDGKKHSRNAARARLLEQLADSLDATESTALRRSFSCSVCSMVLNSIEQYHAHLQGSKHQNNLKQHQQ
ncbi:zinc finger protein [Nematolebias whitei]|uniref:zinc finger protein n=1 Tax=Nematolebias whitei TaxID=451745 RepID=UPI00189AB8AC|nr:zinc finger protein [Nematolebias whitei]